jgi:signal recognition particle receptor subunit beta
MESTQEKSQDMDAEVVMVEAIPVRTTVRRAILPFLPPPLVQGIRHADPLLAPYIGEEPSITILGSLLLAYFLYQLLRVATFGGKAIVDDEEEALAKELKQAKYSQTILLLGPPRAGKTRLFYQLCHDVKDAKTAISLRPNVGFKAETRFMDYPGHLSLAALPTDVLSSKPRILLLLDSTQPMATAAEVMMQLLTTCKQPTVLVLCHQSDKAGAKNSKRVRLQLRTEVERLLKTNAEQSVDGYVSGEGLVLEDVAKVAFISTSPVSGAGMDDVIAFVKDGKLPEGGATKR